MPSTYRGLVRRHSPTVVTALTDALATEPGRPLVTFYDGASGERVELSVTTFANWVNKVANLAEDLLLDPGDLVAVDLPTHWLSTVTLLGVWAAGMEVVLSSGKQPSPSIGAGSTGGTVCLSVVGPTATADPAAWAGQVVACSLRPLGGRFSDPLPNGWLDFAAEVPPQPDLMANPAPVRPDDVALRVAAGATSHAELVKLGRDTAVTSALRPGGRLLTDLNPTTPEGVAVALVGPLVTGSSVVLLVNADGKTRGDIAHQERVTCERFAAR